eukprot:CAMPEP_0196757216 /NCGR_PEP_ID=MMETSP1091-20130531/103544_1 /TAXON_ID=302021 /ORGANISM="Rhodomonas sp., Strain CCMP768" /LENGTH=131 /DNA_ID=CAMNT_0042105979 /DNA_START=13 /DNA_END=405 /DNA_ORIENTATION=+
MADEGLLPGSPRRKRLRQPGVLFIATTATSALLLVAAAWVAGGSQSGAFVSLFSTLSQFAPAGCGTGPCADTPTSLKNIYDGVSNIKNRIATLEQDGTVWGQKMSSLTHETARSINNVQDLHKHVIKLDKQ